MKVLRLCACAFAIAAAPMMSALAAPEITRVGPANFPISSVVVLHDVGGVDIAFASGTPGSASAGDTKAQTVDSLTKLLAGLKAQGFSAGDVVMLRVYLVGDPAKEGKMDFAGMMAGYTQFFGTSDQPNKPARTTVQIAGLASPGSLVEIEAEAARPHK
ncbi:MAG TPA: Rid family hydrolase [Caulobacteraceae bacterium]|jgi:enamine deaminase RidA (YjgF/YER057c/UK114 family)